MFAIVKVNNLVQVVCFITLLLAVYLGWDLLLNAARSHKRLMLVDFYCFKVPEHLKISRMQMMDLVRQRGVSTPHTCQVLALISCDGHRSSLVQLAC